MIATNNTEQGLLDQIVEHGELDAGIRVIHGHFHYSHFAQFFDLRPETRVITWLRDPLSRIVSNYNYLISSVEQSLSHTPQSQEALNRLLKNLLEFARIPRDINLYRNYLDGGELADYDFVGIMEHYQNELIRLSAVLNVTDMPSFHVNRTPVKTITPTPEDERGIAHLYAESITIYKRALDLAEGRVSTP